MVHQLLGPGQRRPGGRAVTGVQQALDCEADWQDTPQHPDHTPPPGLLRLQELHDLQDQGARPSALRCAHTVPTGDLL